MNDKLISANKLMNHINNSIEEMTKVGVAINRDSLWRLINYAIEAAPTIDAEVVRCKDCKYNTLSVCYKNRITGKEEWYKVCEKNVEIEIKDDWFCANGERKESEGEE